MNRHRLRRAHAGERPREGSANERRARKLGCAAARVLTPPDPSAYKSFGRGSVVVPPSRVSMPEAIEIGDGVVVHEHAWLSVVAAVPGDHASPAIGDRTSIGRFSHIACVGEIDIGPEVLTSERIFIGDTYHGYEDVGTPVIDQPMAAPQKVTIERGAFLGDRVGRAARRDGRRTGVCGGRRGRHRRRPAAHRRRRQPRAVVRHYDDEARRWVDEPGRRRCGRPEPRSYRRRRRFAQQSAGAGPAEPAVHPPADGEPV